MCNNNIYNGFNNENNMRIHFTPIKRGKPKQPVLLSSKQKETVNDLARGLTLKMIAYKTNQNLNTVAGRVNYLLNKYQVNNTLTLIIKLHQLGEIDVNEIQILKRDFNNAA